MLRLLSIVFFMVISINTVGKEVLLNSIHLPAHFKISVYAEVPDARSMTLGDKGIVFVGTRAQSVYALLPNKNYSRAKKVVVLASHLNSPNGVAFYHHNLYVAEINRILKFPNIEDNLTKPIFHVFYDKLPTSPHHGWRYIAVSPDHWLYVAIGAPCNVCESPLPYATIARIPLNGTDFQVYAKGVRNSVGFDWSPITKKMWFTENGRDWLGDAIPPDELNYAPHGGMNFGFPYFYGNNQPDPDFGKNTSPDGMIRPAFELPAHVAALGMRFYTGKMFPKQYHNQLFIAEHGSWNRSRKVGYQVVMIQMKNNQPVSSEVFASGWLKNGKVTGRPVDLLVMPDGALLVSDDDANVVYRISY